MELGNTYAARAQEALARFRMKICTICLQWAPSKTLFELPGADHARWIIRQRFRAIEGRRHDSTILSISQVLDVLRADSAFEGTLIYGDPAYGCSDRVCSPFPNAAIGSREARFNSGMSSVREAV